MNESPLISTFVICFFLAVSVVASAGPPTSATEAGATPLSPLSCLPRFGRPELLVETLAEGQPGRLVIEDFNQDGLDDVFVARNEFPGLMDVRPAILLNDGSGGLVESTSSVFLGPVPELPLYGYIVVADFNGDTHPDVFWASAGIDLPGYPGAQNRLFLSAPGGKLMLCHMAGTCRIEGNIPMKTGGCHDTTTGT
jgi:hypothetical protein